jgi:hypothetical protein
VVAVVLDWVTVTAAKWSGPRLVTLLNVDLLREDAADSNVLEKAADKWERNVVFSIDSEIILGTYPLVLCKDNSRYRRPAPMYLRQSQRCR